MSCVIILYFHFIKILNLSLTETQPQKFMLLEEIGFVFCLSCYMLIYFVLNNLFSGHSACGHKYHAT